MTWNPRLDVVEALEEFGWIGDEENPLGLLRHGDAVWGVGNDSGDSSLTEAGGAVIEFPSDASVELVVAGCLGASWQLVDLIARAGRLNLALASAKRRAKRREPHEREGLIFHLERENKRVHEYVQVANEAAQVSHRSWESAIEEARKLPERNGELLARIDALTERLEGRPVTEYRLPPIPPNPDPVSLASKCFDCRHTFNWHNGKGRCSLGECTCDQFQGERYVIGRNGVFATLYDWQEHRLVVDNATEEHCRRVRDELTAPRVDEPKPTPAARRSMPLLEAVAATFKATSEHAERCGICHTNMRLAEMCPAGQKAALDALEPDCAHVSWEVTGEHRNDQGMWVKYRRCADCADNLASVVEPEPHWPDKAAALHPAGK
ncbi:hypothetical protein ABTX60_06810 [Streptomyces sp. NPDC126510]|uniref:hypothetical protein n=1 Tax=Streptomyces sp. NPDC126510 TaxID=3155317 RepID=UPI00331B338F